MREGLKNINGTRQRFIATFERFGIKSGWQGRKVKTYLFVEIKNKAGQEVCDHLWMSQMKSLEVMNLQPGDKICFDARVKTYTKGYKGRRYDEYESYDHKPIETDYKLSHPNNIVKHVTGSQGELF